MIRQAEEASFRLEDTHGRYFEYWRASDAARRDWTGWVDQYFAPILRLLEDWERLTGKTDVFLGDRREMLQLESWESFKEIWRMFDELQVSTGAGSVVGLEDVTTRLLKGVE